MSDDFGVPFSDDDSEEEHCIPKHPQELHGTLCKWTNYIHGWQNRYFLLRDSKLIYYKNENEASFGCRGSISVYKAAVKPHEIDECRFDVCLNDSVWYLRADSEEEKKKWVIAIEQLKDMNGLRRHGSALSLTPSTASTSSNMRIKAGFHPVDTDLRERLFEFDTYRDIVIKQMDALQSYFDSIAQYFKSLASYNGVFPHDPELGQEISETPPSSSPIIHHNIPMDLESLERQHQQGVEFRGEALTFKATTAGILTTLQQCVDIMTQREEHFKRRLEREVEKRKRLEERMKNFDHTTLTLNNDQAPTKYVVMGGPDYEEGPHSVIGEDEFFDAVESALDKMDEEEQFRERLRQKQRSATHQPTCEHPLWPVIEQYSLHQLNYAQEKVDGGLWQLFCEDGEMKLYKRELEEDGLVVDPLKAIHQVRGVTAHEMAHHFWSPDVRFEWETTLEQMTVLDNISEDTIVFHQLHKRVWPTAQRDALFWSHIREVVNENLTSEERPRDTWIVCNKSTEHPDAPNGDQCVRVDLLVCLVCQTFVDDVEDGMPITRKDLRCKITYCSIVNPGGWAPSSVLRAVYKREYPKFLKRFTQYVIDKSCDSPISFSGLKILNHNKHWRG